jgi:hypothetical protein
MAPSVRDAETSAGCDRHGTVGPVVVVGSAPVVVGPLVVGSVVVVVASVVVGTAVVVGAAVVLGPVTGAWVVAAPRVENASAIVVVPELAGAWALAGPETLVALLTARGAVSGLGAEPVGTVVGSRGPVVDVGAGLGAGSAGTVGSARAGARRGGGGWGGSRVAEATRAARTAVVSPQGHQPEPPGPP